MVRFDERSKMRTILLIIVIQVAVVILSSFFLIKKTYYSPHRTSTTLFVFVWLLKNFSVNNTLSTGFLNKVIPAQWEAAAETMFLYYVSKEFVTSDWQKEHLLLPSRLLRLFLTFNFHFCLEAMCTILFLLLIASKVFGNDGFAFSLQPTAYSLTAACLTKETECGSRLRWLLLLLSSSAILPLY